MSSRRNVVTLAPVIAIGLASCAQLLGGPFESIEDASAPNHGDGSTDTQISDAAVDVAANEANDYGALDTTGDVGVDAPAKIDADAISADATIDAISACSTAACSSNAECASLCPAIAGEFACCVSVLGGTRCSLSTTGCLVPDAGHVDSGAADAGCTGCWQGSVCMAGNLATACGLDGATCEICPYFCGGTGEPPCTYGMPSYAPVCRTDGVCDNATVASCCTACSTSGPCSP